MGGNRKGSQGLTWVHVLGCSGWIGGMVGGWGVGVGGGVGGGNLTFTFLTNPK